MSRKHMIPGNTNEMLNKILYNYVSNMDTINMVSLYFDLSEKYKRERRIIKRDGGKLVFLDKLHAKVRNFNTKHFATSRVIDRLLKLDAVKKIYSYEAYRINNMDWSIVIDNADSYEREEILANSLESYENFSTAIQSGVISIQSFCKIHNEMNHNVDTLNAALLEKMRNNSATFSTYIPEVGDFSDEAQSEMIMDYALMAGNYLPEGVDPMDRDSMMNDISYYFLNEYYLELKKIVLRLFNAYLYIDSIGKDIENLERDDYILLDLAFHYYTLYDEQENLAFDDEYINDYASLPLFYKTYIHNLVTLMVQSINQVDEFDELNEEKRQKDGVVVEPLCDKTDDDIEPSVDFNDLTLKLLHQMKKHRNRE